MSVKPNIIVVISHYVDLKPGGREHRGLCPFHGEKTPSFFVSEERQAFYCFGCQASGDVITFIRKLKGLSYREALADLGVDITSHPRRQARSEALLIAARHLSQWANEMTSRASNLLRYVGHDIEIAKEIPDNVLIEHLGSEWVILETLAEDLQDKHHVIALYHQREVIENILADGIVESESFQWPTLTDEYRDSLRGHLPSERLEGRRAHG